MIVRNCMSEYRSQLESLVFKGNKNMEGRERPEPFAAWSDDDDIQLEHFITKLKEDIFFSPNLYKSLFVEYMEYAAAADQEKAFRMLLSCMPDDGSILKFRRNDLFLSDLDPKRPFNIKDRKYWKILYENEKQTYDPDAMSYVVIQEHHCLSNAPGIYLAILDGDIFTVRFYLSLGASMVISYGCETSLSVDMSDQHPQIQVSVHDPGVSHGYFVKFRKNRKAVFFDAITAAVLSGKKYMIDFIRTFMKSVYWNPSLEKSIIYSSESLSKYLLECFPEILDYLTLENIMDGDNTVLWDAFINKAGISVRDQCRFMENFLDKTYEDDYENPQEEEKITIFSDFLGQIENPGIERTWNFYEKIGTIVSDPLLKGKIRRHIFARIGECHLSYLIGGIDEKIYDAFGNMDGGLVEYTPLLLYNKKDTDEIPIPFSRDQYGRILLKIKNMDNRPLGWVDLYKEQIQSCRINRYTKEERKEIMRRFPPIKICPMADPWNCNILRINHLREVKDAIHYGYITPENAFALYEYAVKLPKCSEAILVALLELAGERGW